MSDTTTVIVDERGEHNLLPILLGVLGGVVVLALLWFFVITPLLLGDDAGTDEPLATPTATIEPTDDAEPTPSPQPTEVATELPVTTYEVYLARDPFDPVRAAPVADDDGAAADGDEADGDGDGVNGDGDDVGDDATLAPTDGETPPPDGDDRDEACTGDDEVTCDGQAVSLIDVAQDGDDEVAVIQVDTTVYEVREGEVFAESFGLLSIDGSCATILFGDEVFEICEGDRVLK